MFSLGRGGIAEATRGSLQVVGAELAEQLHTAWSQSPRYQGAIDFMAIEQLHGCYREARPSMLTPLVTAQGGLHVALV